MDNTGVFYINPQQLKKALVVLWKAKVPAAIFGAPGCGKTTAVTELVQSLNRQRDKNSPKMNLWSMILSYKGPEDIGGVPYPNKDHTRVTYLLPEELPFDTDEHGIIFGDEFDRASPETQNSFLQLLLGGTIHGSTISPNAYVVLAMNGTSDIYTTQLSEAAVTRVCSLFVATDSDGYLDSYDAWAETNNISPTMRAFAKFNPDLVVPDSKFDELAKPTPRTRDMADRILQALQSVKFDTSDVRRPLLAGVLGKAGAVKLLAFSDRCDKMPDPKDIIKDPEHAKVPKELDVLYTLTLSLVQHIKNKDDIQTTDKLVTYALRLPDEVTHMFFRRIYSKCDKVVTNVEYNEWAKKNKFVLGMKGK